MTQCHVREINWILVNKIGFVSWSNVLHDIVYNRYRRGSEPKDRMQTKVVSIVWKSADLKSRTQEGDVRNSLGTSILFFQTFRAFHNPKLRVDVSNMVYILDTYRIT